MAKQTSRKAGARNADAKEWQVPGLKPGKYTDGLPLDEIQYLECKLILKPNRFTSRKRLFAFGKVLAGPAEESGVGFLNKGFAEEPLKVREILFLDTVDFRLYNNGETLGSFLKDGTSKGSQAAGGSRQLGAFRRERRGDRDRGSLREGPDAGRGVRRGKGARELAALVRKLAEEDGLTKQ